MVCDCINNRMESGPWGRRQTVEYVCKSMGLPDIAGSGACLYIYEQATPGLPPGQSTTLIPPALNYGLETAH